MLNAIQEGLGTHVGILITTTMYINMDNAGGQWTGNAIDTNTTADLDKSSYIKILQ